MARHPRSLEFEVNHAPSEGNYAHTLIEGENTMVKCQLLAEGTTVVRRPPPTG
ncbi:MAG: hypothetical protein HYY04_09770 [Chloroflexi bacterium]|nr:hypothetical protein [Chloroflexota bacterium]